MKIDASFIFIDYRAFLTLRSETKLWSKTFARELPSQTRAVTYSANVDHLGASLIQLVHVLTDSRHFFQQGTSFFENLALFLNICPLVQRCLWIDASLHGHQPFLHRLLPRFVLPVVIDTHAKLHKPEKGNILIWRIKIYTVLWLCMTVISCVLSYITIICRWLQS